MSGGQMDLWAWNSWKRSMLKIQFLKLLGNRNFGNHCIRYCSLGLLLQQSIDLGYSSRLPQPLWIARRKWNEKGAREGTCTKIGGNEKVWVIEESVSRGMVTCLNEAERSTTQLQRRDIWICKCGCDWLIHRHVLAQGSRGTGNLIVAGWAEPVKWGSRDHKGDSSESWKGKWKIRSLLGWDVGSRDGFLL
jgi:hypothetical protein